MKLLNEDKTYLKDLGYSEQNIRQIQEAIGKTVYTLDQKKISSKCAIEILGRKVFLSGISRSAFHWSATREAEDGRTVCFDSSRLFK